MSVTKRASGDVKVSTELGWMTDAMVKAHQADRRRIAEKVGEAVREEIAKRLGTVESLTTRTTADRVRATYITHVIEKVLEEER
jgi:hypothetical protein